MTDSSRPPKLSLIQGGRDRSWQFGALNVWIAVAHEAPFFPDYELIEEDTWRVIGAGRKFREVKEHPIRVMTDVVDQPALEAGSCFRRGRRVFLVMHDIEQDPVCRPEWIDTALACAFRCVDRQQGGSLSLPPPGVEHGHFSLRKSLAALTGALRVAKCEHLGRVWLQVTRAQIDEATRLLDQFANAEPVSSPS